MESADREERLVVRFALGLASLILAGAVLGALGVGFILRVPRELLQRGQHLSNGHSSRVAGCVSCSN
jgi:hypothetical protein